MNTPGTIHINAKIVKATENRSLPSAYMKIRQAFNNLPVVRKTKISFITIKEYCEFWGFDLKDYVNLVNEKCNMKIIYEDKN